MHSIHNIVEGLNESLGELFAAKKLTGSILHGIAVTVTNKDGEKMPVIMGQNGEGTYVGLDDRYPVRLYHKHNSLTSSIAKNSAYGDSLGAQVNTYSMSMVVFMNRKKIGLFPDELLLLIQSNFVDFIILKPYDRIKILFTSAILNDMQVYNQEYLIPEKLLPEHNLFQINYTVETSFKKRCFNKCPED